MQDEILNIDFHVRRLLLKALNICRTRTEAATALGISTKTLQNKMDVYEVEKENGIYISKMKIPLLVAA